MLAPTGGPEDVSCISSSSTSLRVSWRPPNIDVRGGLITHYTLQYTRRDSDPLLPTQDAHLRVQVSWPEVQNEYHTKILKFYLPYLFISIRSYLDFKTYK